MANIRPPTRTPGSLKLLYKFGGIPHRTSVNFLANIDINNISARRGNAILLASVVQGIMPSEVSIDGWALYTRPGTNQPATLIYEEPFNTPYVGAHANTALYEHYVSATFTITGQGIPGQPGYATGATRSIYFVGAAYPIHAGQIAATNAQLDTAFLNLKTHLAGSTFYWADFYGQKASVNILVPVQFNAAVQRRHGA